MQKNFALYLNKKRISIGSILILLIFILGFSVRIYGLTRVPYGFHADEASIGYNAYTILTKGTDEYGKTFPVFFKSFGEYKSPVQIYSTVPVIALLGLNEFSTRFTSVIYGMFSLLAIYFLSLELFKTDKNKKIIALFALFFLATSPWHIQFSRVAYELMPFVFFTTLGLFLFLKAQSNPKLLAYSFISFALALYSYYAGRIFIPLFGIGLVIIYFRFFLSHKKETIISTFLLLVLLIPFIQGLFSQEVLVRWQQTNIFNSPPQHETLFTDIEVNYLRHYSFPFLFIGGNNILPGNHILRDAVSNIGELYFFQLPLIILGVYQLLKKRNKTSMIIFLWLLFYPVSGIFSNDGNPFARRSIIGVIPFQILSAVGSVFLLQYLIKMKKFVVITVACLVTFIIFISFGYYLNLYFIAYPKYSSSWWGWQYGPKDIIAYFTAHESEYNDLVMAPYFNGRYEFFKFYAPNDCTKCKIGLPGNYFNATRKQLYALPPSYIKRNGNYLYTPHKILYYPDGSEAFILTEIKE